ncbi:MAG: T9SS type A sorting domain-containing protein [Saprospiraceae bacterium]
MQLDCPDDFAPVCGCDKNTYINECNAIYKGGIKYFTPNPCQCKDTNLINLEKNCNDLFIKDPVCGCDSVIYLNSCQAIYKHGITAFYKGICKNTCIASNLIDTFSICSEVYDPICGCDKKTYLNECVARNKFGVTTWQKGHCDSINNVEEKAFITINLYPNPVLNELTIESNEYPVERYKITSLDGNIVAGNPIFQKKFQCKLNGFRSGLYIIHLVINGSSYKRKIIITN